MQAQDKLVQEIRAGAELAIILQPDHNFMGYTSPAYNETYNLPFIFGTDTLITGLTRPGHLFIDPDKIAHQVSFAYTNASPVYSIIFPYSAQTSQSKNVTIKLNDTRDYAIHQFMTRSVKTKIFEVTRNTSTNLYQVTDFGLRDCIQKGALLRLVLEFNPNSFISFPIDIAYDYFETGRVEFRTETVFTSHHVVNPKTFQTDIKQILANTDNTPKERFSFDAQQPSFLTYLRVMDDGSYYTVHSEISDKKLQYNHLAIFEV